MIKLAESMSLRQLIEGHNNVHDLFHLDEHQPLCLGYQLKNDVRYLCVSTASMLSNLARGFRKHFDDEDNFFWLHQCLLRIFLAPTEEIAAFLQASLVIELLHRGEPRTSGSLVPGFRRNGQRSTVIIPALPPVILAIRILVELRLAGNTCAVIPSEPAAQITELEWIYSSLGGLAMLPF